jgi:hypothetical protein
VTRTAAGPALPGASGVGPFVNAPGLYRADHSTISTDRAANATASPVVATSPASTAPAPAPASRSSAANGWLSGVVEDSVYFTPVVGVSVDSPSTSCASCSDGSTNSTGAFLLELSPGPTSLTFYDLPYYLVNKTFPTVVSGVVTSVGTVLLVHLATVDGRVLSDLAGRPPAPNVTVTSDSRDGNIAGPNITDTLANGTFSLLVDPWPIEVDFARNGSYVSNATWADPTPWQVVDLGTLYLDGGLTAQLTVVDGVTGLPVVASVTFCSDRIDAGCLAPGNGNGTVQFPTVAGTGVVQVAADGYVTNMTQVPTVPHDPTGVPDLGTVDLLPLGAVEVTVNFSGGTPNDTWPSALPADGAGIRVWACSLSGMDLGTSLGRNIPPDCVSSTVVLGNTTLVPAPPLRDLILVQRAYFVPPGFPVAETDFMGGDVLFPNVSLLNVSWANVTPDHVTDVGTLNISAGTYLYGSVGLPGTANGTVVVQVCSTVRTAECLTKVTTDGAGQIGAVAAGCPTGAWDFCVPAPPGPDRVDLKFGTTVNSTWITVPFGCCSQEDRPTDLGPLDGVFHFSGGSGAVTGTVGAEGAPVADPPPAGWNVGVSVCPVTAVYPCYQGTVNATSGAFSLPATLGWDVVTVSGRGLRSNTTWVDVTANNTTGHIEVGPDGFFGGQVVSSVTGDPILEAFVSICDVAAPHPCYPGTSTSGSNGTYNGSLPALPFPSGTFEFLATASGYDTEGVFANVTPGSSLTLPTIRMPPVGSAGGAALASFGARRANSSTPTTGSWVIGRAVDSVSGLGVGDAVLTVCQIVASAGCALTSTQTVAGGEFNLSTVHGAYEIWINGSHYAAKSVYLNASTAGTVDLGSIAISPLGRIVGRVLIDPWPSLYGKYGEGADQVVLIACNPSLVCGPPAGASSDGSFNVSAPAGTPDTLQMIGGGPEGQYGNTLGGYNQSGFAVDVSTPYTTLNGSGPGRSVSLKILGGLTGFVHESVGTALPGAGFAVYAVSPPGVVGGATGFFVGGTGFYAGFLPDGWTDVRTTGLASGLVPGTSPPYTGTVQPGLVVAGPNVTTVPFGYVTATFRDVNTTHPVFGVLLTVLGGGPGNVSLSGAADSNGLGFVNVTAPPGPDALSTGTIAYQTFTASTLVSSGATDAFGPVNLTALADGGFATVRSLYVNDVGDPPTPGAFDNVSNHPVEGVFVVENAPDGVHSVPAYGNDLGQYFVGALPSPNATITFSALGFTSLNQAFNLPAGRDIVEPQLNLTANGVLTGTVTAEPGNVTVAYATVVVCGLNDLSCTNAIQTNATGVFWIGAPAGIDQVSVQSELYLSNLTKIVNVTPDSFLELGTIPVFTFGTVHGFVRGLPYGQNLSGVNVSICSKFSPPGGCLADETVATDANGSFSMQSPPGTYYLYAVTPGYNESRFPIVIGPGANLFVGTLLLQSYGAVLGEVVNATGVPVAGATVLPCPTYAGPCGGPATTMANGSYALSTSPGPNTLTASAAGYLDSEETVVVITGGVVHAPTIVLTPIPPDVFENVSGTVTAASSGVGLPNALVVADEDGGRAAQAVSGAGGQYRFEVRWGTVQVFVGAPNYQSVNETVDVHANVTGLNFALPTMTYLLQGVTSDGGTGTILVGVTIANNGTTVARSDANGAYQVQLPNGTTTLTASYATNGTIQYGTVKFPVQVTGAAVEHNIALPRTEVPLGGIVVDAATGKPLPSASVTLWTPEGHGAGSRSTDSQGRFAFGAGPGTYNVSVSAPGFEPANQTVATGVAGNYTTVSLQPLATGKSGGSGIPLLEWAVIVGGAVAVGAAAVVAVRSGRNRPPPADPVGEELLPEYEPPT